MNIYLIKINNMINLVKKEELDNIIKDIVSDTKEVKIENASQLIFFSDVLQRIKGKSKQLDEMRKNITKPIDAAKKEVMTLFKKPLELLEETETKIKKEIATYLQVNKNANIPEGISMRSKWNFRIVNEDLIPKEYWIINESAIRGVGEALGNKAAISGIEFYEEHIIASTSK